MIIDELEAKLIRLISFPLKDQIKIDFDRENKTIIFSVRIYRSKKIPFSVHQYVQARQGMTFRPHKTSFHLEQGVVSIAQEIPFKRQSQKTLRQEALAFWRVAKTCHQMLMEIAAEEKLAEFNRMS